MARKPRWEFEGAIYHVFNRGNCRKDLFFDEGDAGAFEKALFEVCEKCRWIVHAYAVMRNQFHLAVETPEANLASGMAWLQGTFANRFNRVHGERGHVFQSRYKSLLVEEGRPLLGLVNFIHLSPVRAGMKNVRDLGDFPFSSYPKFFKKSPPDCLSRAQFLGALKFPDSVRGMRKYAEYLETAEERDATKYEELAKRYSSGWALASAEYRKEIKKLYAEIPEMAGWQGGDVRELREGKWEFELEKYLKRVGKTTRDVLAAAKSAPWKVRIARDLKRTTTATNSWIARSLAMGHPSRVSNLVNDI